MLLTLFFTNVGKNLDSKIPNVITDPLDYLNTHNSDSFFMSPTDEQEVFGIINKLKPKKVTDSTIYQDGLLNKLHIL